MNVIKNSKSNIKRIVDNILSKIYNDEFVIIPRDKNKEFMMYYRLTKKDIKQILCCISIGTYISEEFDSDTLKYGPETVVIFIVERTLVNINGEESSVRIYIKIKNKEDKVPVISIHEAEK